MPRLPDPQEGATTAEYVAAVLLVSLLVGALVATGVAPSIGRSVNAAFCVVARAIGADCSVGDPGGPGGPPLAGDVDLPSCTLATEGEGIGGSVTVASVQIGGDGSYDIVRQGNGDGDDDYLVELDITGSAGLQVLTGGKVDFAEGIKGGRFGELSASGELTYAPTFAFDSEDAARAFAEQTRELITGVADDTWDPRTLIPVWGPGRIVVNQHNRIQDYDPPEPSRTRVSGGLSLEGSGGLYGGGQSAEGDVAFGRSIGGEINHETGELTLFHQIDADIAAELGFGAGGLSIDADGGVASELVLGVTLDESGDPSALQVGWTGQAQGGVGLPSAEGLWFAGAGDPTDVSDLANVGLDVDSQDTWSLEATATLDLDDPSLGDIGSDVVDSLLGGDVAGLRRAGGNLMAHVRDESDLALQYHAGQLDQASVEAAGGAKLAFGFGAHYESSNSELVDAWFRPGGGSLLDEVCGTT